MPTTTNNSEKEDQIKVSPVLVEELKLSKMPTMEEMILKYAPKVEDEIGEVYYSDEDEEERLDTMSNLLPFEEKCIT